MDPEATKSMTAPVTNANSEVEIGPLPAAEENFDPIVTSGTETETATATATANGTPAFPTTVAVGRR